jgi:retron-type reverse transcriptase
MESFLATADIIASVLTAPRQDVGSIVGELDHVLGRRWQWTRALVERYLREFRGKPRPLAVQVRSFLTEDPGFQRAFRRHGAAIRPTQAWRVQMSPLRGPPSEWHVPSITSCAELAHMLGVSLGELDWLADVRGWNIRDPTSRRRHYHYRMIRKREQAVRLIEAPKPRLKSAQRSILREILDHIPPHAAAHGFRRQRSIQTYAAPHVAQAVVLKLDLREFFPTIRAAQIRAMFLTAGYPQRVAECLTGLCTTAIADSIWDDEVALCRCSHRGLKLLYAQRHLPQGAPTSPALANLAAFRLDSRLSALARSADANYTRYADDLAFSGGDEFARRAKRFYVHAAATIEEEGFRVNFRKTRIMRQGVRQQVAGLVLNRRINARRDEYERLKAILYNCVRHGPAGQNRKGAADFRAHLLGRIEFIGRMNEMRGQKLASLFAQIAW